MICPRLHSRAGQGTPGLCPPPSFSSRWVSSCWALGAQLMACGPWTATLPLLANSQPTGQPGRGPFPDGVASGEGGSQGLESAPTGPVGPRRAAAGSGPLGTGSSRGEGAEQSGLAVGRG